jgi:hypothetical protein
MYGAHGRIGAGIFVLGYLPAMLLPPPAHSSGKGLMAWAVVIAAAAATPIALKIAGGGGAGEALGLILVILTWVGRFAGPAIASWLAPNDPPDDLWRVIGGSFPALLFAVAVFALAVLDRET